MHWRKMAIEAYFIMCILYLLYVIIATSNTENVYFFLNIYM